MSTRKARPRDLPYPAAGGTYNVVDGALQPQQAVAAPATEEPSAGDAVASGAYDPSTFESPRAQMDSYGPSRKRKSSTKE